MNSQHEMLLGVNIDHVATLRQQRGTRYPEVLQAALIAEQAGADSITVHLREDRRHIQDRDIELLANTLQTRMNLEMAMTTEMLAIAARVKPADCCIVPEKREELTTEGGLDVVQGKQQLVDYCAELKSNNIRVSLFIDADKFQLDAAKETGAEAVEIHTGHYADATNFDDQQAELEKIQDAVRYGNGIGLQVNAGHGLDYHNVKAIASTPGIRELNIGHSIIAWAIFTGLSEAVREMKARIIASASD